MAKGSALGDREVLLRVFLAMGGESWEVRQGWVTNDHVGDWFGVTVNAQSRVVELDLNFNNLCGNIPRELRKLSKLTRLDLRGNHLTGEIPEELGGLVSVKTLDLSANELRGEIPTALGNLPKLITLSLQDNHLTGKIPKELGDLVFAEKIYLSANELTGEIPKELGRLVSVSTLDFSANKLTGKIPRELGNLPGLAVLNLQDNRLTEVPLAFLRELRKQDGFDSILNVAENPLRRPPQTIMTLETDQAISWWEDIKRFGEGTSNKLKMVLVGLAEAGKTTVARNITGRTIPNSLDRTVGIEITDGFRPVEGGPLEISIWDFAGQADYYASHQIFLTQGTLFLLVVDLRALFVEAARGVEAGGDPHGRVYRWLEMLHLRVPGAAVALVGTHADAAEFTDPAELKRAVDRLKQLIARYREDKAKEVAKAEARHREGAPGLKKEKGTRRGKAPLDRQESSRRPPEPLFIHDEVFTTSINSDSTSELVGWISKAATLLDCPTGFQFPAVRATIPQVWIDANLAMDGLKAGEAGKPYVTWRKAVRTFGDFMEIKGNPIPDPEEILLRAMRHREAEGGVLLSLQQDPRRPGESVGMLYLDPTWLIEVIRRLTDHHLADTTKEGTLKKELEKYGEEHNPPQDLDILWAQHRSYRRSGTLDMAYLRFLWLHRHLDNAPKLQLNLDEFNSVLATMETLLVLYRTPATDGTHRALFVVPARLPEYGDEQVLEKGNIGLGDAVVRTRCSFRRSYAPPGLIGRFLAFANAHIKEARECWQHGAHLVWKPTLHDILLYETHSVEHNDSGSVAYPGLALCVKGSSPAARDVLDGLTAEVKRLFADKSHGYPGLCSVVFEDTDEVLVSDLGDLRTCLENRFDQLEALVRKVAGVTSQVLQAFYLSAKEENRYPRLLIFKPENSLHPGADGRPPPVPRSPSTACATGGRESHGAAEAEAMQRETWNGWIKALTRCKSFRMVFICEHDMTEVPCGPGGHGYVVQDLPELIKACWPLLQVSFYALRVAVGMVSNVDLPLDDLLAALVMSASTELLGTTKASIPAPSLTEATPLPDGWARVEEQQEQQRLQKQGYEALCKFMQRAESPSTACCGYRSRCATCGSARRTDCACVNWRDEMDRVSNGKGGLVWVKKSNKAAYKEKIDREAAWSTPASPVAY